MRRVFFIWLMTGVLTATLVWAAGLTAGGKALLRQMSSGATRAGVYPATPAFAEPSAEAPARALAEARRLADALNLRAVRQALDIAYIESGSYPSTLDQLVPQYLDFLPRRSDGSDLHYELASPDQVHLDWR